MNSVNITLLILFVSFSCTQQKQQAQLQLLNQAPSENIIIKYEGYDMGGNTSVVNDSNMKFKFSGESVDAASGLGYFNENDEEIPYIKRNRDLGQTFTLEGQEPKTLRSITVRTGFGTSACREGIFGENISLQIMEVSGKPTINENESTGNTKAFHGFPNDRYNNDIPAERDDFYTGETYKHLKLWQGFQFPSKKAFGYPDSTFDKNHEVLKGRFLQFVIPEGDRIQLESGKTYAFVIMIDQVGESHGFTLANNYIGSYEGGHGIRRSGKGTFPPLPCFPEKLLSDPSNVAALDQAQLPTNMEERIHIQPGTNGYPDVDTFRDMVFYIEAE